MDKDVSPITKGNIGAILYTHKMGNVIMTGLFILLLLLVFALNIRVFSSSFLTMLDEGEISQTSLTKLELDYQEQIKGRTKFINLYGLTLRSLNSRIVGNFSFIKDDLGILQCPANVTDEFFLSQMKDLKKYADNDGTPLIYIALPDKTRYLPMADQNSYSYVGQISGGVVEGLEREGINCIKIEDMLGKNDAPSFADFFFKTDAHCTTYGEFWMAKEIAAYLRDYYDLNPWEFEKVFDLNNYSIEQHLLVGNYARSVGEYYTKLDTFEIYIPNYPTDFSSEGLTSKNKDLHRAGDFESVMMNNYDTAEEDEKYVYWVTDYGQFRSPYYKYINNNAPDTAPDLLIISDSVFMRGFCYLSNCCKSVSILDPRFFNKTEYLSTQLATNKYDAVVVIGLSDAFFKSIFYNYDGFPDLLEKAMITKEEYGMSISNKGICLDSVNGQRLNGDKTILISSGTNTIELYGWAADFCTECPLSALYIKLGDNYLKCEYGIKRSGLVKYYGKDSLLKCGFRIIIPISAFDDSVNELSFIGISSDGKARYEPVRYQLRYQ